jgi:hypothetical protein
MLTTYRGCGAYESACAWPYGVIRGFETTSSYWNEFPRVHFIDFKETWMFNARFLDALTGNDRRSELCNSFS